MVLNLDPNKNLEMKCVSNSTNAAAAHHFSLLDGMWKLSHITANTKALSSNFWLYRGMLVAITVMPSRWTLSSEYLDCKFARWPADYRDRLSQVRT